MGIRVKSTIPSQELLVGEELHKKQSSVNLQIQQLGKTAKLFKNGKH